ncbi:monocarboxylate transporter 10-like, partial [Paramuricea clavata]
LIGSINYGMMFLNGPIAAALAAKYGCRATSMVGSAIFSLGFLLSSYAQHIVTLYVTYGVMVGFGASLCYFSSLVAVGQYFYNKLSLANGIISSGSGIGSLVMGPVMNNLLKHLGWRDTLRVYAGMAALIFMSAILYRHINTSGVQQDDGAKSKAKPEKAKFIDFTIFKNTAYIIWYLIMASARNLQPMPPFDPKMDVSAVAQRWEQWLTRFQRYLLAMDIKSKARQRAMLLYAAGPE